MQEDGALERRLAAVLVADVVGYSRLMEADEAGTLKALKERRTSAIEPVVRLHGGRIVKEMGDGFLVERGRSIQMRQQRTNVAAVGFSTRYHSLTSGVWKGYGWSRMPLTRQNRSFLLDRSL